MFPCNVHHSENATTRQKKIIFNLQVQKYLSENLFFLLQDVIKCGMLDQDIFLTDVEKKKKTHSCSRQSNQDK